MIYVNIAITKLSSKGQIVIPSEMRKGFSKGEKLLVIKSKGKFIVEKIKDSYKKLEEDLAFAEKTEKAFDAYQKGKFKKKSSDDFLKELGKW